MNENKEAFIRLNLPKKKSTSSNKEILLGGVFLVTVFGATLLLTYFSITALSGILAGLGVMATRSRDPLNGEQLSGKITFSPNSDDDNATPEYIPVDGSVPSAKTFAVNMKHNSLKKLENSVRQYKEKHMKMDRIGRAFQTIESNAAKDIGLDMTPWKIYIRQVFAYLAKGQTEELLDFFNDRDFKPIPFSSLTTMMAASEPEKTGYFIINNPLELLICLNQNTLLLEYIEKNIHLYRYHEIDNALEMLKMSDIFNHFFDLRRGSELFISNPSVTISTENIIEALSLVKKTKYNPYHFDPARKINKLNYLQSLSDNELLDALNVTDFFDLIAIDNFKTLIYLFTEKKSLIMPKLENSPESDYLFTFFLHSNFANFKSSQNIDTISKLDKMFSFFFTNFGDFVLKITTLDQKNSISSLKINDMTILLDMYHSRKFKDSHNALLLIFDSNKPFFHKFNLKQQQQPYSTLVNNYHNDISAIFDMCIDPNRQEKLESTDFSEAKLLTTYCFQKFHDDYIDFSNNSDNIAHIIGGQVPVTDFLTSLDKNAVLDLILTIATPFPLFENVLNKLQLNISEMDLHNWLNNNSDIISPSGLMKLSFYYEMISKGNSIDHSAQKIVLESNDESSDSIFNSFYIRSIVMLEFVIYFTILCYKIQNAYGKKKAKLAQEELLNRFRSAYDEKQIENTYINKKISRLLTKFQNTINKDKSKLFLVYIIFGESGNAESLNLTLKSKALFFKIDNKIFGKDKVLEKISSIFNKIENNRIKEEHIKIYEKDGITGYNVAISDLAFEYLKNIINSLHDINFEHNESLNANWAKEINNLALPQEISLNLDFYNYVNTSEREVKNISYNLEKLTKTLAGIMGNKNNRDSEQSSYYKIYAEEFKKNHADILNVFKIFVDEKNSLICQYNQHFETLNKMTNKLEKPSELIIPKEINEIENFTTQLEKLKKNYAVNSEKIHQTNKIREALNTISLNLALKTENFRNANLIQQINLLLKNYPEACTKISKKETDFISKNIIKTKDNKEKKETDFISKSIITPSDNEKNEETDFISEIIIIPNDNEKKKEKKETDFISENIITPNDNEKNGDDSECWVPFKRDDDYNNFQPLKKYKKGKKKKRKLPLKQEFLTPESYIKNVLRQADISKNNQSILAQYIARLNGVLTFDSAKNEGLAPFVGPAAFYLTFKLMHIISEMISECERNNASLDGLLLFTKKGLREPIAIRHLLRHWVASYDLTKLFNSPDIINTFLAKMKNSLPAFFYYEKTLKEVGFCDWKGVKADEIIDIDVNDLFKEAAIPEQCVNADIKSSHIKNTLKMCLNQLGNLKSFYYINPYKKAVLLQQDEFTGAVKMVMLIMTDALRLLKVNFPGAYNKNLNILKQENRKQVIQSVTGKSISKLEQLTHNLAHEKDMEEQIDDLLTPRGLSAIIDDLPSYEIEGLFYNLNAYQNAFGDVKPNNNNCIKPKSKADFFNVNNANLIAKQEEIDKNNNLNPPK